ncbi:MAG: integrase family protein [Thermomicrobiales bacterium]|nr:integrase family protein [Thermomicrobiales bacterium]
MRTIHQDTRSDDPDWLARFIDSLQREDLSAATARGYRYDLRHFLVWHQTIHGNAVVLERLTEFDLIAYRQAMITAGNRPTTVNRRLDALRRLCRWAQRAGLMSSDLARDVRRIRLPRHCQPLGLQDTEVHAILRAAGASTHGLARRNYALVQFMLQTGLRVGEVAALRIGDLTLHDRSGCVHVRHGKGLKDREVPLNATVRRAMKQYFDERPDAIAGEPLFLSGRAAGLPVRSIQAVIAGLARRARLSRIQVSCHTLRHTFALAYLRDNPGKLVELATLLGHDSLDTTALYTRSSRADLAADLERSHFNVDG